MKQLPISLQAPMRVFALMFSFLLSACQLDSTTESASQAGNELGADTIVTSSFSGSVGDGPVVGATLNIYDKDGNLVRTVTSDDTAKYSAQIKTKGNAYPLTIEVEGGTDLVTRLEPDFRMISFVAHPSIKTININPFTTMIVEAARSMPGGLSDANVAAAEEIVEEKLNFGLDPRLVDSAITTKVDDVNIVVFAKSSESMGEMIRRTRDHLRAIGVVGSGDDVVTALADDIADGALDGLGGRKANIRVATVSRLVSAQVVIEALSNNLRVGGVIATDRIDDAIVATHPLLPASTMTDSVPVNSELLTQGRINLKVAQNLSPGADVDSIATTLNSLRAGSLPSEIKIVLPAGSSEILDQPISLAVAATDEQLDAAVNGDGTAVPPDSPTEPPLTNRAPVLSGTPATTVLEDALYLYQPSATDADGDTLSFSIQNRPDWASFDAISGRLSGTPTDEHVGNYSNIVVTVSDGKLSDTVGPFSITVTNTNDAPRISGSAASSATAGGFYSFQPSANDPDGDALTFSIAKRPSWASFNTDTGRLSGTPANSDAGSYDGIVISVSDGRVSSELPAFAITVTTSLPSNRAPVISGVPASSVAEDSAYVFQPTASDADGDTLTYSISNRPAWASFNSTTGRLTGTPRNTHVGSHNNILITVSDGAASASVGPFTITVTNTNDAPVIGGAPARSVAEDSSYAFQPSASDPDGDNLTFSVQNAPAWASFDASSGVLSGTPTDVDAGIYDNIVISVSDGTLSSSLPAFSITVNATQSTSKMPHAEFSMPQDVQVFAPGDGVDVVVNAFSLDSSISIVNVKLYLDGSFVRQENVAPYEWSASKDMLLQDLAAGTHSLTAVATDSAGATAETTIAVIVEDQSTPNNNPPTISGAPPSTATVNTSYSFAPSASDADGDNLTFSIANKPNWANFDTTTGVLQGVPSQSDLGVTRNISITVSDGSATATLNPFNIDVTETTTCQSCASAGSDQLASLPWVERSDWINVKTDVTPAASGDGVADDTAAIKAALNRIGTDIDSPKVVYLPPGTYRITATLSLADRVGGVLMGHGADTTIVWDGAQGGRMFWSNGNTRGSYIGVVWDGAGIAGVGIDHDSKHRYESRMMHEYMEFRNFTIAGIRVGHDQHLASAEMFFKNLKFVDNDNGLLLQQFNDYNNVFDGCHFINNGYGINIERGNVNIRNSRFEGSSNADFMLSPHSHSIRRVVSVGSNAFIHTNTSSANSPIRVENCLVDGWLDSNGAIVTKTRGPLFVFDSKFISPPSSSAPIKLDNPSTLTQTAITGNVSSPETGSVLDEGVANNDIHYLALDTAGYEPIDGSRLFLASSYPMPEVILDVKVNCGAIGNGTSDDTAAIQSCLDQAYNATEPTEVYFPAGIYNISSTLEIPQGANYSILGVGRQSTLTWVGSANGTTLRIDDPNGLRVERIAFGGANGTTTIHQTGSQAGSIYYHNVFASITHPSDISILFDGLPSGTKVVTGHIDGNIIVRNSSEAEILFGFAAIGDITVEGTTPQTGLLGTLFAVTSRKDYSVIVRDNQSITMTDWYNEQTEHLISLEGNGTGTGRVVLDLTKAANDAVQMTAIDNYAGLLAQTGAVFGRAADTNARTIAATNAPYLRVLLMGNQSWHQAPITSGVSSETRVGNSINDRGTNPYKIDANISHADSENDINTMVKAFRELGAFDLQMNYGK